MKIWCQQTLFTVPELVEGTTSHFDKLSDRLESDS